MPTRGGSILASLVDPPADHVCVRTLRLVAEADAGAASGMGVAGAGLKSSASRTLL